MTGLAWTLTVIVFVQWAFIRRLNRWRRVLEPHVYVLRMEHGWLLCCDNHDLGLEVQDNPAPKTVDDALKRVVGGAP